MNQNSQKKKTGIIVAMSMLFAVTLSLASFGQAVALQDYDDNKSSQVGTNFETSADKTIRLTGGDVVFVPSIIKINVGDKITFLNVDGTNGGMAHAIISVDGETGIPDNIFDSGLLKTGDRFEFHFPESGIYTYIDSMHHPEMHGVIIVA